MVKDISPGSDSARVAELTDADGTLFFTATDDVNGLELWKSDGTEAGTVMVKDIWPGPRGSLIRGLANVNDTVFFRAADGTRGRELWKSDGTEV